MKLWSTFGFEFTFMIRRPGGMEDSKIWDVVNVLARNTDFKKAYKKFKTKVNISRDDNCVEIRTPKFTTSEQIISFYKDIRKVTDKYDLVTHRKDTTSGGGHIHVGIPDRYLRNPYKLFVFLDTIFLDFQNRPYLNWIFNDPYDNESAESFDKETKLFDLFKDDATYNTLYIKHLCQNVKRNSKTNFISAKISKPEILHFFDAGKSRGLRVDQQLKTIEFRIFDATHDLEEVIKHFQFVNSYMKHIEDQVRV